MNTTFSISRVLRRSAIANCVIAALSGVAGLAAQNAHAQSITCGVATTKAGGTANGLISADTPTTDGTRMFALNTAFNMSFVTAAPAADTVTWSVQDFQGNIQGSGTFAVPSGTQTSTLSCKSTAGGYYALTASLSKAGGTLPRAGTRPTGIASFGVIPNVSGSVPAVAFAHQDQHRFGMQGFNGRARMLSNIGVTQQIDSRQLSTMEPTGPNTWTPSLAKADPFYQSGNIMRLVRLDGIPGWASPTGAYQDDNYAPTDLTYYQNFMARVGTDTEAIRAAYFPNQQKNYYQVMWEPLWKDTSANLISFFKSVYDGLHSTDPNAVVMAPTEPSPGTSCKYSCTGTMLANYASMGLAQYIDGVTTHSYYNDNPSPMHPPEELEYDPINYGKALDQQLRQLRAQMQQMKPNMRLWSSEVGISYDPGTTYSASWPTSNQLTAQAAIGARTHLIVLGEGAQVTYFFYGSDYPSEPGFGSFFDIVDLQGSYSASALSPKPVAMAYAALTRIIDGTQTLGHLNGLPASVYGYAFQQLNGGKVITALWMHDNATWTTAPSTYNMSSSKSYALTVDGPGTSGTVSVLDIMGNARQVAYTNGVVNLTLTESPIYVVSSNAAVAQAHVTAPLGYTGQ